MIVQFWVGTAVAYRIPNLCCTAANADGIPLKNSVPFPFIFYFFFFLISVTWNFVRGLPHAVACMDISVVALYLVVVRRPLQQAGLRVEETLKSSMLLNPTYTPMLTIESDIKVDY